jgi:hypothetical protein
VPDVVVVAFDTDVSVGSTTVVLADEWASTEDITEIFIAQHTTAKIIQRRFTVFLG